MDDLGVTLFSETPIWGQIKHDGFQHHPQLLINPWSRLHGHISPVACTSQNTRHVGTSFAQLPHNELEKSLKCLLITYCWWNKSQTTTWDVYNLANYGKLSISTGAGFHPTTFFLLKMTDIWIAILAELRATQFRHLIGNPYESSIHKWLSWHVLTWLHLDVQSNLFKVLNK